MKRLLVVLAAGVALAGCGSDEGSGLGGPGPAATEDCIILVNGGNKLCGEEAKAWCDASDELRQGDPSIGYEGDSESQAVCDEIRGQ